MNTSPAHNAHPKLSVSLAIEGLQEASEEIERTQTRLEDLRAIRDDLLIELAPWVSITKLARLTGLSRERVSKIASSRRRGV